MAGIEMKHLCHIFDILSGTRPQLRITRQVFMILVMMFKSSSGHFWVVREAAEKNRVSQPEFCFDVRIMKMHDKGTHLIQKRDVDAIVLPAMCPFFAILLSLMALMTNRANCCLE